MESRQTQGSGKLAALNKCAHGHCTCTVAEGEEYCSDYCAESMQADDRKEDGCQCGHAECTTVAVPLTPVVPFTS